MFYSSHLISKKKKNKKSLWRKVKKLFKGIKWLQNKETVDRLGTFQPLRKTTKRQDMVKVHKVFSAIEKVNTE